MKTSRSIATLVGWLGLTFLAPLAGFWAMPDAWFQGLAKPAWNPPAWIFGPVWTVLYVLMAIAAWLVWKRGGWKERKGALTCYIVQLFLNAIWTPIFFGAHQPGWALGDILLLWVAIVVTVMAFAKVSRTAAWLLIPYLAWVSFASFLNFTLWRMNG